MGYRAIAVVATLVLGLPSSSQAHEDRPSPSAPHAQANQPPLVVQLGHSGQVSSVAFSPDGRWVLTGGDQTARLWETDSGKLIRSFQGHSDYVSSVAFSRDGRWVLTGSHDNTARLWEADTGKEVRSFLGHELPVNSVAFSPDGRWVLTGSNEQTVRLWDMATGKEIRSFKGHASIVNSVAFSPDSRWVLTGSQDHTARLWEAATGKEVRSFQGNLPKEWLQYESINSVACSPNGRWVLTGSEFDMVRLWEAVSGKLIRSFEHFGVTSVAFSADGRWVLTGGKDKTVRLWEAATGKEVRAFQGHSDEVLSVAFSRDGRWVLTSSRDATVRLWEAASAKEIRSFEGYGDSVSSVAFSPDGRWVLTGGHPARLWEAASGKLIRSFKHAGGVTSVAFSPDGRWVLVGGAKTARLWEAASGKEIRSFESHSGYVSSVAFSRDGRWVLTGERDGVNGTARLWEVASGKQVRAFQGHSGPVLSVAFSPDGRSVLTGAFDSTARLWEATSGKQVCSFEHEDKAVGISGMTWIHSVAFSPDGRWVLTGGNQTARLWEVDSGKLIRTLEGHSSAVHSVAFSPDGRWVLTGSADNTARLWETASGKQIRAFEGHSDQVSSVAFSRNGRWILTGSWDQTARLWETATGKELCRLVSFNDGSWAVVDSVGRFDASSGGSVQGLHWVIGNEPIDLVQLKERYYEPGLLAKHLGFNHEPLTDVEGLTAPKLFPQVQLKAPTPDKPQLDVLLTNRGGGIGRVVVKVNGTELTEDARPRGVDSSAKTLRVEVPLADDPRLKPGEDNTIEVQAYNDEGYLRSRAMIVHYVPRGQRATEPIEVWAVVAGVSKFRGRVPNLRYAAKDAEDFALALQIAAGRFFGKEHVHLTLLTTDQADAEHQPTRANLVHALDALCCQAKPNDLLVLYLAGHGVNFGGREGDFYYLSADVRSANLTDPDIRKQGTLSSRELTELIKKIPVQHKVLVLDTCAAARAVEQLTDKREGSPDQELALQRVKDRTGLFILAGCAADAVSYEASRYAQGLLTYSLLEGMRGVRLRKDKFVDVGLLFDFAADRVPELATDIGGIQRPVIARPEGASFDIGMLTEEDKARIPVRTPRPWVLRSTLLEDEEKADILDLGRRVDERLREASARGQEARLVFADVRQMPQAYQLSGTYKIDGDRVTIDLRLGRAREKRMRLEVSGDKAKPEELAAKIVAEVEKQLGMHGEDH